jgi:small-conductance mechanosensitive channel
LVGRAKGGGNLKGIVVRSPAAIILLVLFLLTLCPAAGQEDGDSPYSHLETSVVWGRVVDDENGTGLENYTVRFEAPSFIGKEVLTDAGGWYMINLSAGGYSVLVSNPLGQLLGRAEAALESAESKRLDFIIDPHHPPQSVLFGYVFDKSGDRLDDAVVRLHREEPPETNVTATGADGEYRLGAPPGKYTLSVFVDDELEHNRSVSLEWGEEKRYNITLDQDFNEPVYTLENLLKFITDNWFDLLLLAVALIVILVMYLAVVRLISGLRARPGKFFQSEWFDITGAFARRLVLLLALLIVLRQTAVISQFVEDYVWSWLGTILLMLISVLVVIFLVQTFLISSDAIWGSLRKRKGPDGKPALSKEIISLLEVITKYFLILLGGIFIFAIVLSTLGFGDVLIGGMGSFLERNAGRLLFLVGLVVTAVVLRRFVSVFFDELKVRQTKMNPQMIDLSKKGAMIGIYFLIGLIFIFTLLTMAGLGEVGQTVILMISMIVGLIVSMAATGSIGNILSGLVLQSTKPYDVGDVADDTIGDVLDLGIMFTKIRDLEGRQIDIPNNNILQSDITNYTRVAKVSEFAMPIDVALGYDVPPKKARRLMRMAAAATPGVLKDPQPMVIVTQFDDHAVEYRLRAYTKTPQNMLYIRSMVMENMMELFESEGYEILSPLYHVKREGGAPTAEELAGRASAPHTREKSAPEALSMFDDIPNGK